jgi:site-specific DNA recombinase
MTMKPMAAIYARVSTPQQEQEATIDSQVAALEAFAGEHGYEMLPEHYFLDQAVSGGTLMRPALDRLRDLAAEAAFQVVLCLSPDRLARNYAHQWVLMDELQRAGVTTVFIDQPDVQRDPQGQLFLGIKGLFAEYERAIITERLRRGKLYRIRQGQLVSPTAPYGYRYVPVSEPQGGQWHENPVEAEVVRQIFRWYTGDEQPTIHQIVDRLRTLGQQAPPRGKRWGYSTVQTILKQPAYTGQTYYNRTRRAHETVGQPKKRGRGRRRTPAHLPRPREEWIEVAVPALLDQTLWDQAQERLRMNQRFATRNNKRHFYLLRSLLVCGSCGRTLSGRYSDRHVYYYCTNRSKNRDPDVPRHSCSIAGSIIESLVWQAVVELLANPALLADAWHSQLEMDADEPDEITRLQARQRTLERQWTRLLDLFQEGLIEKKELSQRKNRLDAERENLTERLGRLERQNRRLEAKAQMLEDYATFCQRIECNLADPTPDVQQEVIQLLIDHIVVHKDEIIIKHIVPTDDNCRLLPGRRFTQMNTDGEPVERKGFFVRPAD